MSAIKYDKLVRDKILENIEKASKLLVVEMLDNKDFKKYLDKKLEEELQEYFICDSVDELADIVEVIYVILKYKGIDIDNFESIRRIKVEERGPSVRKQDINA